MLTIIHSIQITKPINMVFTTGTIFLHAQLFINLPKHMNRPSMIHKASFPIILHKNMSINLISSLIKTSVSL